MLTLGLSTYWDRLLSDGENKLAAILNRIDEPPALFISAGPLQTDHAWASTADGTHFQPAQCWPYFDGPLPHQQRIPVDRVRPLSRDGNVFDFGRKVFGYAGVNAVSPRSKVRAFPGESVPEVMNGNSDSFEQIPIDFNGKGRADHLSAFRYLRVESRRPVKGVYCDAEIFPTAYRGAFACDDALLNTIWMRSAYTLRLCMREFFVDGIKRDRMPWVGDLYLATACNAFSFAEHGIAKRAIRALAGEDPRQCHANGIIDYSLYRLMSVESYVMYSGDVAFAREMWPQAVRVLAALAESEDGSGWLVSRPGDWMFLDWAELKKTGTVSTLQTLYALAIKAAGRVAELVGEEGWPGRLGAKARALAAACRGRFWNAGAGAFGQNEEFGEFPRDVTRHANFMAVLAGVADQASGRRVLGGVLRNAAVARVGTPYMRFFEGLALAELGAGGDLVAAVRSYWGGMVGRGATTFWEAFDPAEDQLEQLGFYDRPFAKSLCHAWAAGPVALLSGSLFGLRPLSPGWESFTARPGLGGLKWACVTVPTPRGEIRMEVEGKRATVRVPAGAVFCETKRTRTIRRHVGPREYSWTL